MKFGLRLVIRFVLKFAKKVCNKVFISVNGSADSPPPLPERRSASEISPQAFSDPRNGNHFKSNPLPNGYEMKKTQQGQVYFVHVPTGEYFLSLASFSSLGQCQLLS